MSALPLTMAFAPLSVSTMLNKLHGQPDSYDKKYADHTLPRSYANRTAEQDTNLVERLVLAHMESLGRQMVLLERSP